ncbi:LytTR family DNA-binding domain-containing protein [uncultured Dokdonia sp.]|uniref:LytR/AlgR family response regulator transcription factor n=1 Tax=uncultured Dokdonia sp. TaxID=575653 RepID=UPI0030EF2C2E|tara:strand:+ start:60505 stop:61260 length:756 start_codon:yes stop_codon:yes gene_type:complete
MIKVLLIDDEPHAHGLLKTIIEKYYSSVLEIAGIAESVEEAKNIIYNGKIDLVFLDIQMPQENGFELFTHFPTPTFDVIFTTAYDSYAIQAFKYSAIDYLLKPIDKEIFDQTLQRYLSNNTVKRIQKDQITMLNEYIKHIDEGKKRIRFNTASSIELPLVSSILYFKAAGNYCEVYFRDGSKIVVSQSLKSIEERLPLSHFFRTHKSYIIAIDTVVRYDKIDKYAVLMDGSQIDISHRRENQFIKTVLENN